MKTEIEQVIYRVVMDLAAKMDGLAYLLKNCRPDNIAEEDQERREGIGYIAESLANETHRLMLILDSALSEDLLISKGIEGVEYCDRDPLGKLEDALDMKRGERKKPKAGKDD
jgi:hypothetical protein